MSFNSLVSLLSLFESMTDDSADDEKQKTKLFEKCMQI